MLSIAYHSQTNGQTKQINQEIGTFLRHYINYQQDNWIDWLVAVEFQYNDKKHTATGHTPFELNFRRHPWKGNLTVQIEFPILEEFLTRLQRSWEKATKSMEMAKEAIKRQFNKKRQNPQELKEENNIQLEAKNIHLNRPSKKLDQKRYGPFKISKDIGQGAFQLELPEGQMIHDVFNENLLTQCKEPQYKSQHMEPTLLLDIINEEEEYKVEKIRKHRKRGWKTQYLVYWKGYRDEHN